MSNSITGLGPRHREIQGQTPDGKRHRLCWTEWGDSDNQRILFCAHGLSRNGRDFDYLARIAAAHYRVICPDYPGRGRSQWLDDPAHYHNEQYLHDSIAIIEDLGNPRVDWIGTSMGGLIGMTMAVREDSPIEHMVLNDVGAFIPAAALAQIGDYLEAYPEFRNEHEAEIYFREVYIGFGRLEDQHYRHMVEHGTRRDAGSLRLHYDPEIVASFLAMEPADVDLWDLWNALSLPMLVVRGERSELLLRATLGDMLRRQPGLDTFEFHDCAHAPSLMTEVQIERVLGWLLERREM